MTIRSIPEGGNASDAESSEPFFASLRGSSKVKRKRTGYETPPNFRQESIPVSSRRSSNTSVKVIFAPMASDNETVVIRRSSHAARAQVDQELQDVISQSCLTARSYAFSHELELFQAPKTTRAGFTRSNSSISMARLSKHESVRVPRRRTTDSSITEGALGLSKITADKRSNRLTLGALIPDEYGSLAPLTPQDLAPSPFPTPPSSARTSPARSRTRVSSLRTADGASALSSPATSVPSSGTTTPLKSRPFVRIVPLPATWVSTFLVLGEYVPTPMEPAATPLRTRHPGPRRPSMTLLRLRALGCLWDLSPHSTRPIDTPATFPPHRHPPELCSNF